MAAGKAPWAPRGNPLLTHGYTLLMKPTKAEKSMERAVAALGVPYRTQYPFLGIKAFADFALLDSKVIIEVDGPEHLTAAGKKKDTERTAKLEKLGWRVVRCLNEQAIEQPFETLAAILPADVVRHNH